MNGFFVFPSMLKSILIVEDEPAIAENIAYALRTDGLTPHHFTLGKHALTALHSSTITPCTGTGYP